MGTAYAKSMVDLWIEKLIQTKTNRIELQQRLITLLKQPNKTYEECLTDFENEKNQLLSEQHGQGYFWHINSDNYLFKILYWFLSFFQTKKPGSRLRDILSSSVDPSDSIIKNKQAFANMPLSDLGCGLIIIPEKDNFENFKNLSKNLYIFRGKELFYWDRNLKEPQKLELLKGKKWEIFQNALQLNESRDANYKDLNTITSYTGHMPDLYRLKMKLSWSRYLQEIKKRFELEPATACLIFHIHNPQENDTLPRFIEIHLLAQTLLDQFVVPDNCLNHQCFALEKLLVLIMAEDKQFETLLEEWKKSDSASFKERVNILDTQYKLFLKENKFHEDLSPGKALNYLFENSNTIVLHSPLIIHLARLAEEHFSLRYLTDTQNENWTIHTTVQKTYSILGRILGKDNVDLRKVELLEPNHAKLTYIPEELQNEEFWARQINLKLTYDPRNIGLEPATELIHKNAITSANKWTLYRTGHIHQHIKNYIPAKNNLKISSHSLFKNVYSPNNTMNSQPSITY